VFKKVSSNAANSSKSMRFTRIFGMVAAIIIIFGSGVFVGSGRLNRDLVFRKSVSKDLPANLNYSSVEELYDTLRRSFDGQLSEEELLDGLKQGLASATGDQYTEYLDAKEYEEFSNDLSGTFSGIGAELAKEENYIVIVSPLSGYPAEKAGLQPRDIITEINGESAYNLGVSEAVSKIRGPVNTKVKLKVVRNKSEELEFEITRAQINIASVESEVKEGNIGYIKVSRFAEDTVSLARKAALDLKQKNVKGIVLDLRGDPGGLLDASVDVSSLWLPRGKTVLEEKRDGVVIRTYTSKGNATLEGIPTVVLINEGSASASEIVAGALKDNGAATLIGEKTFGKGSVQSLEDLPGGGVLKVTIARWFTPNGKNIDKEGIEPDQKVELSTEDFKNKRDPQLDAALKFLNK
jgi:carboxyl-terminal processing protease